MKEDLTLEAWLEDAGPAGQWTYHFDQSIKVESTRAKVVLAAIYLDEILADFLSMILRPVSSKKDPLLDGPQAALGTFSSKTEMAYRLGLVSEKTYDGINYVRRIRNKFAHNLDDCDFEDPSVKALTAKLLKLNDHASESTRTSFAPGPEGDFDMCVSWLVFWIRTTMEKYPTKCAKCGSDVPHVLEMQSKIPGSN